MNNSPQNGETTNRSDRDARLLSEEALRRSEQRYRALIEATSQAVWSWSPEGANREFESTQKWWEEITGQTPEEQSGIHSAWLEAVHPEDREAAGAAWGKALTMGTLYEMEYRVRARDGGWRHIHARGVPIFGADGSVREWVGTLNDVTDSRKVEEQLRTTEERSAAIIDSFTDGFLTLDRDWRVTFLNAGAEEILKPLQKTRSNLIGKHFWDEFPEAVGTVFEQSYRRAMSERVTVRVEAFYSPLARWIDVRVYPSRDGISLYFLDVTDRKLAEEAQARLAAIVESSEDAIVSKTLDGVIRSWNAGAERLFGYTASEVIGKHITIIIPSERHDEESAILGRIREGKRVEHFETVRITKDGRRIDISLTVSPVRDSEGRVIGASKVARDITERKRADEILRDADRKKDEFIALLAHELRNPLAPLRNGLQVLRLVSGGAGAADRAREMMDRQLSHMVRLVDDLLDISRINQNKMELRRSRVTLADIVNSAVETAQPVIDEARHELFVTLPARQTILDADPTRLAQVFSNLLTNSAKYTERGGRIWLSAERAESAVRVTVRDTGIGIPKESLPKIFDMFSQVDRSIERSTGGLGIGLALVKGLVEMHGGSVSVASEGQGMGTTFVVTLPSCTDEPDIETPSETTSPSGPARRILVVDDNRDGADSLGMMLELAGSEVVTAYDGLEATERAGLFRPDIILMDVGMPRLNGLDATRRIRAEEWGRNMTIIALTGWGQDSDKERSREAGCDGHLVKPVSLPDLETLLTALDREKVD